MNNIVDENGEPVDLAVIAARDKFRTIDLEWDPVARVYRITRRELADGVRAVKK